eukprot:402604-Pyramimonas_sp.AAC.1
MAQITAGVAGSRRQSERKWWSLSVAPMWAMLQGTAYVPFSRRQKGVRMGWSLDAASTRAMAQGTAGVALSRHKRGRAPGGA